MKKKRGEVQKQTKTRTQVLTRPSDSALSVQLQPKKVQRNIWLVPSIYGGVIVAAIIIFAFVIRTILNTTPDPSKTLNTYCSALKTQDYGTAYKQFDTGTQKLFSVVDFVQYAGDNGGAGNVTNCHVKSVKSTDTQASGIIEYTYADKSTHAFNYRLLSDANGDWKIANVSIPTPTLVLTSYCDAIKKQDYTSAYALVSNTVKTQEAEPQFATKTKRFGQAGGKGIASCSISNVVNGGAQATGTITYTSVQGRVAIVDYVLIEENGIWKLASEQPRLRGSNGAS